MKNNQEIQKRVAALEAELNGLKAELNKPELVDGQFYTFKSHGDVFVFTFKKYINNFPYHYFLTNIDSSYIHLDHFSGNEHHFTESTPEEIEKALENLAKIGKCWDAEKKQVVDIEKKFELWKPKYGQGYFCIYEGRVIPQVWTKGDEHEDRFNSGSIFKTEEEAERKMRFDYLVSYWNQVADFVNENNTGDMYSPIITRSGIGRSTDRWVLKSICGSLRFDKAIQLMGEENVKELLILMSN